VAAIRRDLGGDAHAHPPLEAQADDLGAARTEGGQERVSITPEGDIVTAEAEDDTVGRRPFSNIDPRCHSDHLRAGDSGGC